MPSPDRTPLVAARRQWAAARAARLAAQAASRAADAELSNLSRVSAPDSSVLVAARASADSAAQALAGARGAEAAAGSALTTAIASWLPPDPSEDLSRLEATYPIVLLPVRLETRFDAERSQLLVRIYPDEISADAHEPDLSAAERAAGQAYWAAAHDAGSEDVAAWRTLLRTQTAPRAAWIVRATDPHSAPAAGDKPPGWSRAVEARLLPDRFVVIASRGSTRKQAVGSPVVEPLALSIAPDGADSDQTPFSPDGTLVLDQALKWTVDFDAAVAVGMGVRLPIDAADLAAGFDRVIVAGVKTSMDAQATSAGLAALFDAHHYTSGLAFLKQGTPTNNLPATRSAYPPPDDNGSSSFDVERGAPRDGVGDGAAASLSTALGLPSGVFAQVDGADLREAALARSMNRVLFPATLGYYFDQILSPVFGRDIVDEIGRHFVRWVVPRGILSALRIGRVPYGFLPVTSLTRWRQPTSPSPIASRMATLLRQLRTQWLAATAQAPHVGRSSDPDQDLLDILSMDASARQVRVRRVLGDAVYLNLARLFNWSTTAWEANHATIGRSALAALGLDTALHPRVVGMNYADRSWTYNGPLVDVAPASEAAALRYDFITWIQGATVSALRQETTPAEWPAGVKRVLLYRFLRHSALAEYHWWAGRLLEQFAVSADGAAQARWSESELVGIAPGTETRTTPWQRLDAQVQLPNTGAVQIAAFLDGDDEQLRALTGVGDFRDSLASLAPLVTAELERLFTESLDAASHRLDAWISALANQRLSELHDAQADAPGCFVGAYGWIDGLRPERSPSVTLDDGRTMRSTPGGYIQAPSMAHAMTAAVLRNAYLTHAGATGSPYAVDLSSAQVRQGRFVLDSVRNGQPPSAVLGYLLERALHERHVEVLIDPIRRVAPLVANKIDDTGEAAETVAARNVVDAIALRAKWAKGQLFDVPGGLVNVPHRDVLEEELARLDRTFDAVADLLLAESVHQAVRGSTMGSAASLDALAQGTRPPDLEVDQMPNGGIAVTHRVAVTFGASPPAAPAGPGWPAASTPRARCEPRLDGWIASLLGDPRTVRCRVQYRTTSGPVRTVLVTFDRLGLCALDVVALARAVELEPAASELDRRILHAAFDGEVPTDAAPDASFTILYAADPSWHRSDTRTVPELLDLANAAGRLVSVMRPLAPTDLVLAEDAASAAGAQSEEAEAAALVQAAFDELTDIQTALGSAIAAVPASGEPNSAQTAALRQEMANAAAFGIASAFPAFAGGRQEGGVSPLPLVDQARSVLGAIGQRLAAAPQEAAARARTIFGRDFILLTGFTLPPGSRAAAELERALAHGPVMLGGHPHAVEHCFAQAGRVREALGRWRLMQLLTRASGAAWPSWQVAQIPHVPGASWVGLPPGANEDRASGTMSLAFHAASGPLSPATSATAPWYGVFLDEWTEIIPDDRQHSAVAFRYEDTGTEAPQTILVCVSPADVPVWDFDSLAAIVEETLDLAKIRTVDLEQLDPLAQIIPAIFLAANGGDETISTPLGGIQDAVILGQAEG